MKKTIKDVNFILLMLGSIKALGVTFNQTNEHEYTIHVISNPNSILPDSVDLLTFTLEIKEDGTFEVKTKDVQKSRMFKNYISHMISVVENLFTDADLHYEIFKHFPILFDDSRVRFKTRMATTYEGIMQNKLNSISAFNMDRDSVQNAKTIIAGHVNEIMKS